MQVKSLVGLIIASFTDLLKRDVSPLVLRLLLYMYTNQTLCVRWGHALSNLFISVKNCVKQGGVLSPILFAKTTTGDWRRLSYRSSL